jgi:monoamine oxidase
MAKTPLFAALRRAFQNARSHVHIAPTDPAASLALRRAFLKRAGAGAAGLAGLGVAGCDEDETPIDEVVAIVGGGMAGIHCAYRLKEGGIDATVYEAQNRVGGRMFSARGQFPQAPDQVCELGGELIDTGHTTLHALAAELGITLDDREETAGIKKDTWWVNGGEVPEATITQQFVAVAPVFQAAFDAAESDDEAFTTLDETSLDQWLQDNVPVATYPELHAVLQAAYRGEYGLENTEQSALNLIYLIGFDEPDPFRIFGVSDERYHTHDGNDTFPTRLAGALDPAQVALEHKLVAARGSGTSFELDFETPAGPKTVQATRIVFAVPFSVLREVDLSELELSDDKRTMIDTLGYGTNAKVMAGFSSKPWRETHMASGALTSDLGVQQTWETSIGQGGTHGVLTNFLGGMQGLASEAGTPDAWIQGVLPDLETVWPGITPTYTGTAVRMHWPTVPTMKGSYACYHPGQWAFWGTEGEREGNVHFCGEHTSLDFQGFMEGAAETGALVAAEILDDQGRTKPQGLLAALGPKLVVPQSCYRAGRFGRMNPLQRRKVKAAILGQLAAELEGVR